ncbi:hypothetical protein BpOF4_21899 (plasmid) [Alkalihalophilus pseudofirmus OF4]|uniref:Conjugal transfer protein n=1 Tax=Alkalihalophilus pseudofirmus (strain ATCC BAA-2126 / JCM 17055 / OF4) TaxID=398511 RepID=D3G1Z9_ALKPO|nr:MULTISPECIES: conjugal transfer protein [Alkalihalophilus]ADC52375.1 hypothetical protein BpOF4_21899 [Alkalihalophilus pseudofirmus OF4]MED1603448.1 conjugal transfer protein [Alkalihalophilus marmarensis]
MKKLLKAMKEKKTSYKGVSKTSTPPSQRKVAFSKTKTRKVASYAVFGVMMVSLLFNVIHFSKLQSIRNTVQASYEEMEQQVSNVQTEDILESPLLNVYTRDFVSEYINISADEEEREQRLDELERYFVSGFDVSSLEDTSEFAGSRNVTSIRLLDIKRAGQNEANVHYLVAYDIKETEEVEKEVTKEEGEGEDKKEVTETVMEEEERVTSHDIEMVIPLTTDGEGFAITGYPSLANSHMKSTIQYEPSALEGADTTSQEREVLGDFLTEFFTSYGISDETLAFMANVDRGLSHKVYQEHQIMESVKDSDNGEFVVRVNVTYRDQETSIAAIHSFHMSISEENGRFFVQSIQ